jgi:hypothetical protein
MLSVSELFRLTTYTIHLKLSYTMKRGDIHSLQEEGLNYGY